MAAAFKADHENLQRAGAGVFGRKHQTVESFEEEPKPRKQKKIPPPFFDKEKDWREQMVKLFMEVISKLKPDDAATIIQRLREVCSLDYEVAAAQDH